MEKYFILSCDRGYFSLIWFEAEDRDKANETFEEEMGSNLGKEWLLDEDDLSSLFKCVDDFREIQKKQK